jgi:integrase-like protein
MPQVPGTEASSIIQCTDPGKPDEGSSDKEDQPREDHRFQGNGGAQLLGTSDPNHYLLPADLSRHTKSTDQLKGGRGFDPTRHQTSWRTSWRSLRKAAGDRILEQAKKENRDLTMEEQDAYKVFQNVRFHDLRHTFVTQMGERGVPLPVVQAMVGHMSSRMVRYYTHISNQAARTAVVLLDNPAPFVGKFVGKSEAGKNQRLSC